MRNDEKQVLVVAKYLNMRKGKIVAQGAHGAMKVLLDRGRTIKDGLAKLLLNLILGPTGRQGSHAWLVIPLNEEMCNWVEGRFKKVCLSVDTEEELVNIYMQARNSGIPCSMVVDSGLTEFHGVPTQTVVAIGPAAPYKIDRITGHLKPL